MRRSSSMSTKDGNKSLIPQLQPTKRKSSQIRPPSAVRPSIHTPLIKTPRTKSPRPPDRSTGGILSRILLERSAMRPSSIGRLSLLDKRGAPKDPRNLADRAYQTQVLKKIAAFLTAQNCHFTISHKLSPNTFKKEFLDTFTFLVRFIDPTFVVKTEEDILNFLKFMSFPYNLTKSNINNATSLTSCLKLLVVLDWMVDLLTHLFPTQIEQFCTQKKGFEFAKPIQKKLIDQVGKSYELYLKEGREEDDEEVFDKIFEKAFGNSDELQAKNKQLHQVMETKNEIVNRCFHLEEKLQEVQTLEEDFENLTIYVENQKKCNEEDAMELKMQEEVLAKLQADHKTFKEQVKEGEAKLLQQKTTFSYDVFKIKKEQNEEKLRQLRAKNRELEEECTQLEVAYSKEKFKLLNKCSKMEMCYNKIVEMLKNLLKEEVENFPLPFQKNLKNTKREAVEIFLQKLKALKARMRSIKDRQPELASCLKKVEAQKDMMEQEMKDLKKQHGQQIAQLAQEKHKLEEEIKTLELVLEMKQEELAKGHGCTISSGLQRECIQLKAQLNQLKQRNSDEEHECTAMIQDLYKELALQIKALEKEKENFLKCAEKKIKNEVMECL